MRYIVLFLIILMPFVAEDVDCSSLSIRTISVKPTVVFSNVSDLVILQLSAEPNSTVSYTVFYMDLRGRTRLDSNGTIQINEQNHKFEFIPSTVGTYVLVFKNVNTSAEYVSYIFASEILLSSNTIHPGMIVEIKLRTPIDVGTVTISRIEKNRKVILESIGFHTRIWSFQREFNQPGMYVVEAYTEYLDPDTNEIKTYKLCTSPIIYCLGATSTSSSQLVLSSIQLPLIIGFIIILIGVGIYRRYSRLPERLLRR